MTEEIVYVGDIGTVILADMKGDISAATVVSLKVLKSKDDDEVEWVGELFTETLQEYVDDTTAKLTDSEFEGMATTDNVMRRIKYITVADDFEISGNYKIQGYLESPSCQVVCPRWGFDQSGK